MTEKRFTIISDRGISDHQKKRLYDLNDFDGMINVTECLNELHDENVELQGMYDAQRQLYCQLNSDKNNIWQDYQDLKKENEQLKQFQDRVFSWIDMHLQRLPTLRDDEFESDNEFADPSLYSGAIQILETMKRELKGD